MAYFQSAHDSKTPATKATVRVYEFGVVKAELSRAMQTADSEWRALTIAWPSGTITPVDVLQ
jgi:hypothetical protein